MNKIVVTGGSGFIGTNLVNKLAKDGFVVLNIDNKEPLDINHKDYWQQIDILNYQSLEKAVMLFNPDAIIHLAAITDLNGKSLEYYKVNTEGTSNIIKVASKLSSLRKVVFTSSMYVCQPGYTPKDYDDYKPHTLYGQSKVEGELLVKNIARVSYKWLIIRPTSIWGPWFNIPYIDFFDIVYQKKYYDFGSTCTKTYGYVDNTVDQIQKLLLSNDTNGKTFYLGDNPPIQISEWANEISHELGLGQIKKIPFLFIALAAKIGDLLSIAQIKFPITSFRLTNMTTNNILPLGNLYEITGSPLINRVEGVKRTVHWLVEKKHFKIKK
jgi:nucleoside-diphosphate-sugar epimerase